VIELLIAYSIVMTIAYYKLWKKNNINYSNYKNCLKALAEYDPKLKEYLDKQEER